MDAQQQLVWNGEHSAVVLGRGKDFTLVFLDSPIDGAVTAEAADRGFAYCGILTVVAGRVAAECRPHMDALYTMMHASLAFAQQVAGRLRHGREDWLEQLWKLPDTRN